MPQIIGVWLGTGYDDLFPMLYMMVPIEVTICAVSAYIQVPLAYMRVRPVALATLLGGAFNVIASVLLLTFTDIGVMGVCAVWVVSMLLLKLGFYPYYCHRLTDRGIWQFLKPIVFSNVVFVALLVLCDILIHFFTLPTSWTWVILSLMAGFFLFFTFSMRFLYTSNERAMILSFLPSFVRRVLHH